MCITVSVCVLTQCNAAVNVSRSSVVSRPKLLREVGHMGSVVVEVIRNAVHDSIGPRTIVEISIFPTCRENTIVAVIPV